MPDVPDKNKPPFFRSLGAFIALLAEDLGRSLAVLGGLWVGVVCVRKAEASNVNDWLLLMIAALTFSSLVLLCRQTSKK